MVDREGQTIKYCIWNAIFKWCKGTKEQSKLIKTKKNKIVIKNIIFNVLITEKYIYTPEITTTFKFAKLIRMQEVLGATYNIPYNLIQIMYLGSNMIICKSHFN